jgi:hypothetical protein
MVTPESKLPFGKYKGRRVKEVPTKYLQWLAKLTDVGFEPYVRVAQELLKDPACNDSLEKRADAFLRQHGVDPEEFK